MTAPAPKPRTVHVAIAAAVVLAAFSVWLIGGWTHGYALKAVDDLVIVAVSLLALVFSIQAARAALGRLRLAWWMLVAALVSWNVGQIIWIYDELILLERPFPSAADVFFVLFPVIACGALLLFWNRSSGQYRSLILLDGVIVAGSLFIVSWLLVMGDLYKADATGRLEFFLSLAYPMFDLVVVTIAAVVLVSASPGQRAVMTLLTVGLIFMAVADSGYAYLSAQSEYASGDLIDIAWVAGLLLLAIAGAAARESTTDDAGESDMPGWASVWLPFAPLMLAGGVLTAKPPSAASGPVLAVGLVLVFTVLARQFLAVQVSRQLLETVADQALRDPLTGLGNRALFSDRLDHALRMRARTGNSVGLLILDLDDFKFINDTLGHAVGDELLKRAGGRIASTVGAGDTIARLGGDEFAVIIEGDPALPGIVVRRVMEAFERPVYIDGRELSIRPSVGLAVAEPAQSDMTADDLLKEADLAMYAAKRSRSAAPQFGHAAPGTEAVEDEEPELLADLRRAIENREFTLVYQPKFRLAGGALVGVEALLRWPHPQRGLMLPDEFLPLVRRHGLIDPMTQFVIDTALDDARGWHGAGVDIPVAVNLFPASLAALELPGRLDRALAARGLDSSALTVEITEDALLDDLGRTRQVLAGLRERGISVAIDDFGSGYSALWYLRDLPVDEVKLDRNFVGPVATDPRAAAVVRAVIDLAHVLLMKTVAEGVENAATADWLRRHGCDIVQGYWFSPPMSALEVLSLPAPASAKSS